MSNEPSYLAFARVHARDGFNSPPSVVRGLIEHIDRDAKTIAKLEPRTVTEADIARAAQAHYELDPMCLMLDAEPVPWARLGGGWKAPHYSAVRTILAAIEPTA